MAQDRAPAAFDTDRCALPQKPGGEHRPTDATMGTGNGGTRHVLSRVVVSRCQPHAVGEKDARRSPGQEERPGDADVGPVCCKVKR